MRILLFTDSNVFAGTERHILELSRRFTSMGFQTKIGCPRNGELGRHAIGEGTKFINIPKRGAFDWQAIMKVRRVLRSGEIDLVHAHNGRTALIAAISIWLAKRGRLVATQHFIAPTRVLRRGPKGVLSRTLHHWLGRRVNRFIAISGATRDGMVQRGDCQAENISVVTNGIGFPSIDTTGERDRIRREFELTSSTPLIVCVARLEAEKNVSSLVAAMRYVIDTHPNAVCVVAGEGNEMSLIQNRIAELGLNNSVRLVGFRDDAISLIAAADIFVLPSLNEPFGLVLLEAMALGKPVVATASGGPLEIVIDGVTGLLVPPATPLQLAEAINRLLCDRELREQMGAAGLRRFQECFTADRMAAETAAVYRQVCDAGRETSSEPIVRPEAAGVSVG